MPLKTSFVEVARQAFYGLAVSLVFPQFWALIYLSFSDSYTSLYCAFMFSIVLSRSLHIAFHSFYGDQAINAEKALREAEKRYRLSVIEFSDFSKLMKFDYKGKDGKEIQVVLLEKQHESDTAFLNFRAYLQPLGSSRSIIIISQHSKAYKFFVLHELGHMQPICHYNSLYQSQPSLRLTITYGLLIFLTPTLPVIIMSVIGCIVEPMLVNLLNREFLADAFAWSYLKTSDPSWALYCRGIAASLAAKNRTVRNKADEWDKSQRGKLWTMLQFFHSESDTRDVDEWIKKQLRTGQSAYFVSCTVIQTVTALFAISGFSGDFGRPGRFLLVGIWITQIILIIVERRSSRAYSELGSTLFGLKSRQLLRDSAQQLAAVRRMMKYRFPDH